MWDTSKPEGQLRRCFDITRSKKELGEFNYVPIEEGLKKTVEWYKLNKTIL